MGDRPRPRTMTGEAPVPPNTDSCNTLIIFCYAVKKSGKSLVTWQKYFNTKKDYDHLYESCTMLREASVHVDFAAKLTYLEFLG